MEHEKTVSETWNSIQTKTSAMFIFLTTLILVTYGAFEFASFRYQMTRELEKLTRNVVNRLASNLAMPFWNVDEDEIRKVVRSEMADEKIHAVLIYEGSGGLYRMIVREKNDVSFLKEDKEKIDAISKAILEGDCIRYRNNIAKNGEALGAVEIVVSTAIMRDHLRKGLIKISLLILILDSLQFFALAINRRKLKIHPDSFNSMRDNRWEEPVREGDHDETAKTIAEIEGYVKAINNLLQKLK